jgi:crotonobetainyl-CoA:carnitine CoA-transferase CaiB-like acyl-CoA transferase
VSSNAQAEGAGLRSFEGVRVVALEQAVAMPFCTFTLAEMGAEVIKIERAGTGDVVRGWDGAVRGLSTGFVWVNANKKSVALDLQSEAGRQAVRELVAGADVFVENLTPGAAARLGLDPQALCAQHPRLIGCSISGYGQDGPYRNVKSYDLTVQGESGMLLTNGYPGMPAKIGLPITDLIAGSNAAFAIASRLYERERTGRGGYVDVAMLDSALPWLGYFPHHFWHRGEEPPLSGMRHQYLCPYGPYLAQDGRLVTLVIADAVQWEAFCTRVVERPEWLADPAMATIESRKAHRSDAEGRVEAAIAQRPAGEWIARLQAAGIPYGEVRSMRDVVRHPQAVHRHMFVTADSPVGEVPLVRHPLAPAGRARRLPALGEHNEEVLGRRVPADGATAVPSHPSSPSSPPPSKEDKA